MFTQSPFVAMLSIIAILGSIMAFAQGPAVPPPQRPAGHNPSAPKPPAAPGAPGAPGTPTPATPTKSTSDPASLKPVALPAVPTTADAPGHVQLQRLLFPSAFPPANLTLPQRLYRENIQAWAEVHKDLRHPMIRDTWVKKWMARVDTIKGTDEKAFRQADLLGIEAMESLGHRFDYYLLPSAVREEDRNEDKSIVGIGCRVELENEDELISKLSKQASEDDYEKARVIDDRHRLLLYPFQNSPAAKAGVRDDDVLMAVDGENVNGKTLKDVLIALKGKSGTTVELTVCRQKVLASDLIGAALSVSPAQPLPHLILSLADGKPKTYDVTVTREFFDYPVCHVREDLGGDIVYVKLDDFSHPRAEQEALAAFRKVGVKGRGKLILDLRDNPGGRLNAAITIVSYLLPEGTIVTLKTRHGNDLVEENWTVTQDHLLHTFPDPKGGGGRAVERFERVLPFPKEKMGKIPIVILINGRSASASELMAGALQFNGVAKTVGTTSRGKGVGQRLVDLLADVPSERRRNHVTSFFFCPAGKDIDWEGIHPDKLSIWHKPKKKGEDSQLADAIALVREEYERMQKESAAREALMSRAFVNSSVNSSTPESGSDQAFGIGAQLELENEDELTKKLPADASYQQYQGALVVSEKHRLLLHPYPGSAAEQAGIKDMDVLRQVGGVHIKGKRLKDVSALLKSKRSAKLDLTVERQDDDGNPETYKVAVTLQPSKAVHVIELEDGLVYVKIDEFSLAARKEALAAFRKAGSKERSKLVLDLRGSHGDCDSAVHIISYLIPEGSIATVRRWTGSGWMAGQDQIEERWTVTSDLLIETLSRPRDKEKPALQFHQRVAAFARDKMGRIPIVILTDRDRYSHPLVRLASTTLKLQGRAQVLEGQTGSQATGPRLMLAAKLNGGSMSQEEPAEDVVPMDSRLKDAITLVKEESDRIDKEAQVKEAIGEKTRAANRAQWEEQRRKRRQWRTAHPDQIGP